jgi:hypothetical protein
MDSLRATLGRYAHPTAVLTYFAALGTFVIALVLTAEGRLWVGPLGDVSSISLGAVAVIYAFSQYYFCKRGYTEMQSMVLGVLLANAFLQTYELAYGMTFAGIALFGDPPTVSGADVRVFILWLVMISPIFLVKDQLRFTRTSSLLLALTGLVWTLWLLYGFPQYYLPGFATTPLLKTSDPYHLSLWLNFGSKGLMGAFFLSLLEPRAALRAAFRRS